MEIEKNLLVIGIALIVVAILIIVGWLYFMPNLFEEEPTVETIDSFEKCAAAGYPIMESYPRQCALPDGRIFDEEISSEEPLCADLCGDGICQEIVCMAVGCPCPETPESCPEDCLTESGVNELKSCQTANDCACGVKKDTRECFVGNKNYVDTETQCPDFCTGIDGQMRTVCLNNLCSLIRQ